MDNSLPPTSSDAFNRGMASTGVGGRSIFQSAADDQQSGPSPEIIQSFKDAAVKYDVPVDVLMGMAEKDSGFNQFNRSRGPGAKVRGIINVGDEEVSRGEGNPYEPSQNIDSAARKLRGYLDAGMSVEDAVKAHVGGADKGKWTPEVDAYGQDVLSRTQRLVDSYMPELKPRVIETETHRDAKGQAVPPTVEEQRQMFDIADPGRPGVMQQLGEDVQRGTANLANIGRGLKGMAQAAVGDEAGAKATLDEYVKREYLNARENPAIIGSYKNIRTDSAGNFASDAGRYAVEKLGENAAMFLPALATGGIGTGIGRAITERAAVRFIEDEVAKGMTREAAETLAAKMVERGITVGAAAGAAPSTVGMETGSIGGDIYKETGQIRPGVAAVGGVAAGALDLVEPVIAIKKAFGPSVSEPIKDMAIKAIVKRVGVEGLKQLGIEGGTEAVQTVIEKASTRSIDGKQLFTPELFDEVVDSALAGAIGGGVMGVGSQAVAEYSGRNPVSPPVPSQQTGADRREPTIDGNVQAAPESAAPSVEPQTRPDVSTAATTEAARDLAAGAPGRQTVSEVEQPAEAAPATARPGGQGPLSRVLETQAPDVAPLATAAGERVTLSDEMGSLTGAIVSQDADGVLFKSDDGAELLIDNQEIASGKVSIAKGGEAPVSQAPIAGPETNFGTMPAPEPVVAQEAPVTETQAAPAKAAGDSDIAEQAVAGITEPPVRFKRTYEDMAEPELRDRLKYIAGQAKAAGGWNKMLVDERKKVEKAINALKAPAPALPENEKPASAAEPVKAEAQATKVADEATMKRLLNDYSMTPKAMQAKIDMYGLNDTHEVTQNDKGRFVITPKAEAPTGDLQKFDEASGTLGVPRAEMPQVKSEHHGALTNFLNAKGIEHETTTVAAEDLKPTQAEFSPEKVEKAKEEGNGDRAVIVSEDGHVIDGHHRWLAAKEQGEDVKAIVLKTDARTALDATKEFPSATTAQEKGSHPQTREGFLSAYSEALKEKYEWARKDEGKLSSFVSSARETLGMTNGATWAWDQPTTAAAWKAIGMKGKPSLKALRALAADEPKAEQTETLTDNVSMKPEKIDISAERVDDANISESPQVTETPAPVTSASAANAAETTPPAAAKPRRDAARRAEKKAKAKNGAGEESVAAQPNEAEHKDAGEPSEAASQEVVNETVTKAANAEKVNPSQMRDWLVGEIDKALSKLPKPDPTIATTKPHTSNRRVEFYGSKGGVGESGRILVTVREGSRDWGIYASNSNGKYGGKSELIYSFNASGPAAARKAAEALLDRAYLDEDGNTKIGEAKTVTFDVPGDGKFNVVNTVQALTEFRDRVMKSPGFKGKSAKSSAPATSKPANQSEDVAAAPPSQERPKKELGPVFREYYHDAEGAIKRLMAEKTGDAVAALYHPEVGDIDLIWGEPNAKNAKGYGLAKIAKKHPEVLPNLQEFLLRLSIDKTNSEPDRIRLTDDKGLATIRIDWDGETKHWLLTAYEFEHAGSAASPDTDTLMPTDDTASRGTGADEYVGDKSPADKTAPIISDSLRSHWQIQKANGAAPTRVFAIVYQGEGDAYPKGHVAFWSTSKKDAEKKMDSSYPEGFAVQKISPFMDVAKESPSEKTATSNIQDAGEKIGGARKDTATSTGPKKERVEITDDDTPAWRKRYSVAEEKINGNTAFILTDTKTGKVIRNGFRPVIFESREAAEKAIPLYAVAQKHRVYSSRNGDGYAIYRRVTDKKTFEIKSGFKTREDAERYMAENAEEILGVKTGFGEEILAKPKKVSRTGATRREGNVNENDFINAFGFRGVEFGNWNNQAERQEVVNAAYDGLMDLAEVLGLPPRALTLDGELALAFGARGHGLSGAKAHYERDYGVINLTKMTGAGSLAHEWFHALDHYLGRQDGKAARERVSNQRGDMAYPAKGRGDDYVSHGFRYKSDVRPELREAYNAVMDVMYNKAEQYVEDTEKAAKFLKAARESLDSAIKDVRKNIASDITYRQRNNKAASEEQLAAFDALAEQLLNGENLNTEVRYNKNNGARRRLSMAYRMSNDVLDQMSAVLKSVRGTAGFTSERTGLLDRVASSMSRYAERIAMMKAAETSDVKTKKVPTSYAMEAKKIDQGRSTDYWTTPHEMAARAFSAFVEDTIADSGNRSDFLAYGANNDLYKLFGVRPFPEGQERVEINKAFQNLVDTFKVREGQNGPDTALYSVGEGRGAGMTSVDLTSALTDGRNGKFIGKLFDAGNVVVHDTAKTAPGFTTQRGPVQAAVTPDGKIHLVAGNLNSSTALGVLLHEIFHSGVNSLIGDKAWKSLLNRIETMSRNPSKGSWMAKAKARAKAAKTSDAHMAEEIGAYAIEDAENAPAGIREIADRIVGAVKAFILRKFGKQIGDVTPGQLRALAIAALRSGSMSETVNRQVYSNGPMKGFVVYHGSPHSFDKFDISKIGTGEGAQSYGHGLYFAENENVAKSYKEALSGGIPDEVQAAVKSVDNLGFNSVGSAIANIRKHPDWMKRWDVDPNRSAEEAEAARIISDHVSKPRGAMYQVRINADPEKFLDWDKPLAEQPSIVKEALQRAYASRGMSDVSAFLSSTKNTGSDAYESLGRTWGGKNYGSPKVASALKEAGVPGIKYFDQISRSKGDGSRNYVIFDDADVEIENKYSIASDSTPAPGKKSVFERAEDRITNIVSRAMYGLSSNPGEFGVLALAPVRPLFTELSDGMPAARHYIDAKQAMDAFRNEMNTADGELLQSWVDWAKSNRDVNDALVKVMFDATLDQYEPDPAKAHTNDHANPELQKAYDSLPKQAKEFYAKIRDAYAARADAMEKQIFNNVKKSLDQIMHDAERRHAAEIQRIADEGLTGKEKDEAIKAADKTLLLATTRESRNRKARLKKMRDFFERNRLKGPYFPLARFGNFFVTLRDADGKVLSFEKFETITEQRAAADAYRAAYGEDAVQVGADGAKSGAQRGTDANFVASIDSILESANVSEKVRDQIYQTYLETLPDLSMRKHQMHRKGRAGFNEDAVRSFAHVMFHSAHQLSRLKYVIEMQDHLAEAGTQIRNSDDPVRTQAVYEEMVRAHDFAMNPEGSALSYGVTSLVYLWTMAGNISSAMVNLSQSANVGIPTLAFDKRTTKTVNGEITHVGVKAAAKEMAKATGDFLRGKGFVLNSSELSADERSAVSTAYDAGLIDATRAHDLAGVAENGFQYTLNPVRNAWSTAMRWASFPMHHTERMNREVTFLAAYRLARKAGLEHQAAIKTASDQTWATHFDNQSSSKPRVARGEFGRMALALRSYQINLLYRIFRDMHQSLNAATPEERQIAGKRFVAMVATTAAVAGVRGAPFYGALMTLAGTVFGLLGKDDDDPEEALRKIVSETAGDSMIGRAVAGTVLDGIPGYLTGTALTNRVGTGDLWFRDSGRDLSSEQQWSDIITSNITPLSVAHQLWKASDDISKGNYERGMEKMLPSALKNIAKVWRYGTEGVQDKYGNPIIENVPVQDLIKQAIGFTPAEIADRYARNTYQNNRQDRIKAKAIEARKEVARAMQSGDKEAEAAGREKVKVYNERYPENRIKEKSIFQSMRNMRRRADRMEFGVDLDPKLAERVKGGTAPSIYAR